MLEHDEEEVSMLEHDEEEKREGYGWTYFPATFRSLSRTTWRGEDGVVAWTVGECKSRLLGKGRGTAGQRLERGGCWTAGQRGHWSWLGQRGKMPQVVAEQKTGQLGIGERRHGWAECMARLGRRNRHGWAWLMLVVDSQGWSWMARDGRDWAEFID
ncbi:hypothetical protein ACFE04_014591 [Oxalis oulophora]